MTGGGKVGVAGRERVGMAGRGGINIDDEEKVGETIGGEVGMGSGEKVGVACITGGMSDEEGASLPSDSKTLTYRHLFPVLLLLFIAS